MLNKSKSKSLNLWKYTLILPVLALFLMSCNTKEIYINEKANNTISTNSHIMLNDDEGTMLAKKDVIDIVITSDYTEDDLKKTREYFAKYDADVTFGNVKRNDKGEIIYLHVSYRTPTQELEGTSTGGEEPIINIPLVYNKLDKTIALGGIGYYYNYTKSYNSKYF